MSGIIPKDEVPTFERWQIGSFDGRPAPRTKPATPPAPAPSAEARPVIETVEPMPQFTLPTAEDIERMHEEARAAGYQAGYAEGQAAAEQLCREAAATEARRFLALATNLQQALDELDQQVADQLLALAVEIAARVVGSTIAVKEDLLLPVIREAIAALPVNHSHVTLRLHPEDAARVRAQLGEQLIQTGTQIVEDGEVSPGGCLIRAGSSEVDASLETRWRRVLEALGAEPRPWTNP